MAVDGEFTVLLLYQLRFLPLPLAYLLLQTHSQYPTPMMQNSPSPFNIPELLALILSYLPIEDLLIYRRVCRSWRCVIRTASCLKPFAGVAGAKLGIYLWERSSLEPGSRLSYMTRYGPRFS